MTTDNPEVVRVSASGTFNGEQVVNVFHFQTADATPFDSSKLTSLFTKLTAAVANKYSLKYLYEPMDAGLTFDRLYGRTLANSLPVEKDLATSIVGTNTGNDAPPMLSAMLKWSTAVADRRHRGRTYLPGLGTYMISTTDSDRLDASYLNTFNVRAQDFATTWIAQTDFSFVLFSHENRNADISQSNNEIQSGSCDPLLRIQRRRRTGG